MPKIIKNCQYCFSEFSTWPSSSRKFCSKKCMGLSFTGKNNPNYGNYWTDENRQKQSELIKSKVDDVYRIKAGSANRGKKFDDTRIKKMHQHRSSESYIRSHSKEIKELIGIKSKEKFTPEFKKHLRQKNEELGNWIPLNQKTDWEIYKKESNWISKMFDLIIDEEQLRLLNEHKVFHSKNNRKGVVRDHRYSRYDGFINQIFPKILRHPVNCEITLHSTNAKKNSNSSLTLDELFVNIINYKETWQEQEICLKLIKDYKNGKRWNRKEGSE
jgi:NUMOD3 motif